MAAITASSHAWPDLILPAFAPYEAVRGCQTKSDVRQLSAKFKEDTSLSTLAHSSEQLLHKFL